MIDPDVEALRRLVAKEGGHTAVADAIDASDQSIYQIVSGQLLPSGNPKGVGPSLRKRLDARFPGWRIPHSPTPDPLVGGVSQSLSHLPPSFAAPMTTIGSIMSGQTPGPFFRTRLEDDSAAPTYAAGVEILWHTERQARPGRLVLVRDKHGAVHVREYRQGTAPGHWIAAALNSPAYRSFDSTEDGLVVIAVKKAVLDPDD